MLSSAPRRDLLSAYDSSTDDLTRAGAPISDLAGVSVLATRLAADVNAWRIMVDRLDHAAGGRLDVRRAATLVLESVFDEVLVPSAWRVLSAALALAQDRL